MIKTDVKINKLENRKTIESTKQKKLALLKNQQNRQTRLIKKNRSLKSVRSQMKGDITTNFTEIKQIIKEYYEQL